MEILLQNKEELSSKQAERERERESESLSYQFFLQM